MVASSAAQNYLYVTASIVSNAAATRNGSRPDYRQCREVRVFASIPRQTRSSVKSGMPPQYLNSGMLRERTLRPCEGPVSPVLSPLCRLRMIEEINGARMRCLKLPYRGCTVQQAQRPTELNPRSNNAMPASCHPRYHASPDGRFRCSEVWEGAARSRDNRTAPTSIPFLGSDAASPSCKVCAKLRKAKAPIACPVIEQE